MKKTLFFFRSFRRVFFMMRSLSRKAAPLVALLTKDFGKHVVVRFVLRLFALIFARDDWTIVLGRAFELVVERARALEDVLLLGDFGHRPLS